MFKLIFMNVLIIQGPNLNLIGLRSAKIGEQVTLDKVNQGLRKQANKDLRSLILVLCSLVFDLLSHAFGPSGPAN